MADGTVTAVDKLLEAQRLYREYNQDATLTMRVVYDPADGYRMTVNGTIFCRSIRDFDAFADRVLELARGFMLHRDAKAEAEKINQILRAGEY